MSRRHSAEARLIEPDPKFGSLILAKFINKVMVDGKKSLARSIVYEALQKFSNRVKIENPLEAFEQALDNARPSLEVKSRRIGGATYQVPVEIRPERRTSMAMNWIVEYARKRAGKPMTEALALELEDCWHNRGTTIKKREDTHKMAEANKAFSQLGW